MWKYALLLLRCLLDIAAPPVRLQSEEKPSIILDPGHSLKKPGALSILGISEVNYNNRFAQAIAEALKRSGFRVFFTRKPDQEIDLQGRVDEADAHNAIALLSIHHDSAQLVHLQHVLRNAKDVYQTREPIRSYSLFISSLNPMYPESLALAKLLGTSLLNLGRNPSMHHAEPIPGENRPMIDQQLGIY